MGLALGRSGWRTSIFSRGDLAVNGVPDLTRARAAAGRLRRPAQLLSWWLKIDQSWFFILESSSRLIPGDKTGMVPSGLTLGRSGW